jgi:hypothetical protein
MPQIFNIWVPYSEVLQPAAAQGIIIARSRPHSPVTLWVTGDKVLIERLLIPACVGII